MKTHNLLFLTGLTLTELLVSTALIGILMIGVVSVDFATRTSEQTTRKDSLIAMRTQKILLVLVKAAQQTTGFHENLGYDFSKVNTSCFRHEKAPPTLGELDDDPYTCFTFLSPNIYSCSKPALAPAACTNADTLVGQAISLAITPSMNSATHSLFFEITVTGRFDPTATAHPINNPEIQMYSRVSPSAHSY